MKSQEQLGERLCHYVDDSRERVVRIAGEIHRNPEVGYEEHLASALMTQALESCGLEVTQPLCGLQTAFKAVLQGRNERPRIGILAEYDALPGLGHACAHHLSAAAALGAAMALSRLRHDLPGTVVIFGTPAEEGVVRNAGGKVVMLEEFRELDAAMMMHGLDMNTVICDSFNREALEIEFIGKAANAGNAEDASKGINALEGVMLFWHAINAIRPNLRSDARVFGIITEGGTSPNIVPDRAVTRLQIRVEDAEYFEQVIDKVKNAARGAGLAVGAEVNIGNYANTYLSMVNNRTLAECFGRDLERLSVPVEPLSRRGVATDMGNVSRVVPSIHPFIAVAPRGTPWHSVEAANATASEMAFDATIKTAKAFGMTVLDLLFEAGLLKRIREEFAASVSRQP